MNSWIEEIISLAQRADGSKDIDEVFAIIEALKAKADERFKEIDKNLE